MVMEEQETEIYYLNGDECLRHVMSACGT